MVISYSRDSCREKMNSMMNNNCMYDHDMYCTLEMQDDIILFYFMVGMETK